ncbi:hypothetical protein PIB30_000398 [Stylosanthes scabra]|uniref:Uncharacterized protein n=1 Tax=Stylosanthes scabra TaxID=79078 RepID=A0ABU6U1D6_9FABA|nr:hypothetical protein [Stylosanthes scabra]
MTKNLHVVGTSSSSYYCFLPRLLLVVGLVCLVVLGSSIATISRKTSSHNNQWWSSHQEEEEKGGGLLDHSQVVFTTAGRDNKELKDFNYMSKRRVPNGPDPIHNRRAGNSGRPPGQA